MVDVSTQRIIVRPLTDAEIAAQQQDDDVLSTPLTLWESTHLKTRWLDNAPPKGYRDH